MCGRESAPRSALPGPPGGDRPPREQPRTAAPGGGTRTDSRGGRGRQDGCRGRLLLENGVGVGAGAAPERKRVLYKEPFVTFSFRRISEAPGLGRVWGRPGAPPGGGAAPSPAGRPGGGSRPTAGAGGGRGRGGTRRPRGQGRRRAPARRPRGRPGLSDPPRQQPDRVSRIFQRGKPAGGVGVRLRPRPWTRRAGEGWCTGEAKVSPFCWRSAAGSDGGECRRSDGLPQEAAAVAAQLRSAGAAAALGTPAGEGVRAGGGEAAPRGPRRRGDWARGSGRGRRKIKVEIQEPKEREERRRAGVEAERRGRWRRGPGGSRAAASRSSSRRSRDGLTAVARADPQPPGTKKGGGREREGKAARRGAEGGGARSRRRGRGFRERRTSGHPRGSAAAAAAAALGELWLGSAERADAFAPPPPPPCVRGGARAGAGSRTSVTLHGEALPVMWLEAGVRGGWGGGRQGGAGWEEMRGFPGREEMLGVRGPRAERGLRSGVGGSWGAGKEQMRGLSCQNHPDAAPKREKKPKPWAGGTRFAPEDGIFPSVCGPGPAARRAHAAVAATALAGRRPCRSRLAQRGWAGLGWAGRAESRRWRRGCPGTAIPGCAHSRPGVLPPRGVAPSPQPPPPPGAAFCGAPPCLLSETAPWLPS